MPVTTTLYISLLDPCTNPNNWIRGTSQISPPEYTYTGGSPKVDFLLLNPFTTNIINCPITYSCKRVSGPILPSGAVDLCNFKDTAGSFGSFNSQTGNYQFSSTDSIRYPPGLYTFIVYGAVGRAQTKTTFTMTLVAPNNCTTTTVFTKASTQAKTTFQYFYTGQTGMVQFDMNPFTTDPLGCPISYNCVYISGPTKVVDLCSFQ